MSKQQTDSATQGVCSGPRIVDHPSRTSHLLASIQGVWFIHRTAEHASAAISHGKKPRRQEDRGSQASCSTFHFLLSTLSSHRLAQLSRAIGSPPCPASIRRTCNIVADTRRCVLVYTRVTCVMLCGLVIRCLADLTILFSGFHSFCGFQNDSI